MGGGALRVVLGDQCSRALSALRDLDPEHDVVLLADQDRTRWDRDLVGDAADPPALPRPTERIPDGAQREARCAAGA